MLTVKEMIDKLDVLDEHDPSTWKKAEDMFRSEDFDFSRLGPISKDIERGTVIHNMNPFALANSMFVILATAMGRYTELRSTHADKLVKPCLYVINGGGSGQGKSGQYEWVANPTIIKEKDLVMDQYEEEIEALDSDELSEEDKHSKKNGKHLKHIELVTSNYTIQSLLHNLRNSSMLVAFDELLEFWKTNHPERGTSLMPELTRLHTTGRTDVSRQGAELRNSRDGALNIYAHGTLKLVQKFFSEEWPIEGTSYRFLMTYSERVAVDLHKSGGASARRRTDALDMSPPQEFIRIFDMIFRKCFKNEMSQHKDEPALFNRKNRNTYNYTPEAAALKTDISDCVLGTLYALASESNEKGKDIKMTMLLKIHNFIDKFALIFQLIRDTSSGKSDYDDLSSAGITNPVDAESVELAFNYMRVMFTNWLVLLGSKPAEATDMDAIKTEERAKVPSVITYMKKALTWKNGQWLSIEEINEKLKDLPREHKNKATDFRKLLRDAKTGSPWVILKENKYTLV